jgi:hypothetical protein
LASRLGFGICAGEKERDWMTCSAFMKYLIPQQVEKVGLLEV